MSITKQTPEPHVRPTPKAQKPRSRSNPWTVITFKSIKSLFTSSPAAAPTSSASSLQNSEQENPNNVRYTPLYGPYLTKVRSFQDKPLVYRLVSPSHFGKLLKNQWYVLLPVLCYNTLLRSSRRKPTFQLESSMVVHVPHAILGVIVYLSYRPHY